MWKKYPVIKWSVIVFVSIIILLSSFGFWFFSLLPAPSAQDEIRNTRAEQLPYVAQAVTTARGKILAVVTSTNVMGSSLKKTGYELTELSRAYYVFQTNGFEVDIASPLGGLPPVVMDDEDMGAYDYAFLNDATAQHKVNHTIPLDKVVPRDYVALFFVGGKGAMFDFPENMHIQSIVRQYFQEGKVIGAVCHGPAALASVTLDNGQSLVADKKLTGFTNEEELFLIPEAATIFPFLLQDKLGAQGADFSEGFLYLEHVIQDGNLVTGQNPWSTWKAAEAMVVQLGYTPVARALTAEENTIQILSAYQAKGYKAAKANMVKILSDSKTPFDRHLLAMHSVVGVMQWDMIKTAHLIRLLSLAKQLQK